MWEQTKRGSPRLLFGSCWFFPSYTCIHPHPQTADIPLTEGIA